MATLVVLATLAAVRAPVGARRGVVSMSTVERVSPPPVARVLPTAAAATRSPMAVAREFVAAYNAGDYEAATSLLSSDVVYRNANLPAPFVGRAAAREHLRRCADALAGLKLRVDDHAEDPLRGRVGVTWSVTHADGEEVALPSRGMTFFQTSKAEGGLITALVEINEPLAKLPAAIRAPLFTAATAAVRGARALLNIPEAPRELDAPEPWFSMIDTATAFYDEWNAGDAQAAAARLAPDVVFCDQNFEGPFVGRAAAEEFLSQCVVLLGAVNFVIDDYAEDVPRRRLALRWHIEFDSGERLPVATTGVSFLEMSDDCSQILSCTDFGEPLAHTPEPLLLPLASLARRLLEARRTGTFES